MQGLKNLLFKNRKWAAQMKRNNPRFFHKLAAKQNPEYFWVGCSDSRVPVNQIIESMPGQIFVHRNISNVVPKNDANSLSSLQYAVENLEVRHIIVCGHYGCGGVLAAIKGQTTGYIRDWLKNVDDVKTRFEDIFKAHDEVHHWDLLCELNTLDQVINIARTDIVQNAWKRGKDLGLHGWIYHLETGLLQDLHIDIFRPDHLENLNIPLTISQNQNLKVGAYYSKLLTEKAPSPVAK